MAVFHASKPGQLLDSLYDEALKDNKFKTKVSLNQFHWFINHGNVKYLAKLWIYKAMQLAQGSGQSERQDIDSTI